VCSATRTACDCELIESSDNCWSDGKNNVIYYPNEDPSKRFRAMAAALGAASRNIVFGICQWGIGDDLAQWTGKIANSWRMSNDILNAWSSVYRITNQVVPLAKYSKPGNFNDMDMLMVHSFFSFVVVEDADWIGW
jgi:alpha-galactosidase